MYLSEDTKAIEQDALQSDEIESDAKKICDELNLKCPSKSSLKYFFYNFKLPRINDDSVINEVFKNKERRRGKPPVFYYKYYLKRLLLDNDDVLGALVEGNLSNGFRQIQDEMHKDPPPNNSYIGKAKKLLILPFLKAPEISSTLKESHIMWVPPSDSLKESDFDQIESTYNSLCIPSIALFFICIPYTILTSKYTAKLREKLLSKCKFIFIMHTRLKFHGVILAISPTDNWMTNYPDKKIRRYNENIPCFFNNIGGEAIERNEKNILFQTYMTQAAMTLLYKCDQPFKDLIKNRDLKFTVCTRLKGVNFEPVIDETEQLCLENIADIFNFSLSEATGKAYPKNAVIHKQHQVVLLDYDPDCTMLNPLSKLNKGKVIQDYESITNSKETKYNIIEHNIASFVVQKKCPVKFYCIPHTVKKFCLVNGHLLLQLKPSILKLFTQKRASNHFILNDIMSNSIKEFTEKNKVELDFIGYLSTSILAKVPLLFSNPIELAIKKEIEKALKQNHS